MDKQRILVIDDEAIVRVSCERILSPEGYEIETVSKGEEGLKCLKENTFDLVLADLKMPDMDGIEVLQRIKEGWPNVEVIIITGFGTVGTDVQAIKLGAFDYIEKPFTPDELLRVAKNALERRRSTSENPNPTIEITAHYIMDNIIETSEAMQEVFKLISIVAPTGSTVLITGESGTGKELKEKKKGLRYKSFECYPSRSFGTVENFKRQNKR